MIVLRQREMKKVIAAIAGIVFAAVVMGQFAAGGLAHHIPRLVILFSTLLPGIIIFFIVYGYFRKELMEVEHSIQTIHSFIDGDSKARLEDDREGSFSKLYHAVNRMATVLEAQAARQKNTKDFFKDTISDISHQLKTPLAALNMYTEIIQENPEDDGIVKSFMVKTQRELDRMEMLILNLLKITRLDAGAVIMNKKTENISDLMTEIKQLFETRTNREEKLLTLSGNTDQVLLCDRDWILEAVSNIVKNALDHTKAGDEIHIYWKHLPAVKQIIVEDNGSGIHSDDIHHIFKRFYRSRFSKDSQGAGLGLPLAKSIVDAHEGDILVESELGKGCKFTLSFLNLTNV